MALSRFTSVMPAAVDAVLRAATLLRAIAAQSGDLDLGLVEEVQTALRRAKETCLASLAEGLKAPEAAEAFLAGLGGPRTLAEFQAGLVAVEAAAGAWNAALEAALHSMRADELVQLVRWTAEGVETRHVEFAQFLPARVADPLRTSGALAALIAAFEAAGA